MTANALRNKSSSGINAVSLVLGCVIWLSFITAASVFLIVYERSPGSASQSSATWPATTKVKRVSGNFTLVMFVHPKCPCTDATITELAVLMTRCRQLRPSLLFIKPSGLIPNWEKTETWYRAKNIPGVTVFADDDSEEAKRFRATTSGQTMLYDPSGKLIFRGGITVGRGHEGDNQGLDTIESLVTGKTRTTCADAPVFGCSLQDRSSPNSELFRLCRK